MPGTLRARWWSDGTWNGPWRRSPPQDQELLLLRYANQVPLQALSRLTGLSRFAIYRRCGRLLTQLREALREEERT